MIQQSFNTYKAKISEKMWLQVSNSELLFICNSPLINQYKIYTFLFLELF